MDENDTVNEKSSFPLTEHTAGNEASRALDNSQFQAESTCISNRNIAPSIYQTENQMNFSSYNKASSDINNAMSSLSIHGTESTNQSVSNRFYTHLNDSNQYSVNPPSHFTPHYAYQSDAEAQLIAFTQPLMSIPLVHPEYPTYNYNYYSARPSSQSQCISQISTPTKNELETVASPPAYYVDSFLSNFSDRSPSNSNNKPKAKHVTFQEPENRNEQSQMDFNQMAQVLSSSNRSQSTHVYTPAYLPHQYPYPHSYPRHARSYPVYSNMAMRARTHDMNMMPTARLWTPRSNYYAPRTPYIPNRFQAKQLYDPNQPKSQSASQTHNPPQVIRHLQSKNKKKSKISNSTNNTPSSTTAEPPPHPITILRKPTVETEDPMSSVPTTSSNEDKSIMSSENEATEEQQKITSVNENSCNDSDNKLCSSIENSSETEGQQEKSTDSLIDHKPTTSSKLSLSSHELLSILQSANCISSLNEYAQRNKLTIKYDYSLVLPSSYTCVISIDNRTFPSSTACSSKAEAQKLACDLALGILYREVCSSQETIVEFSTKHDYIAYRSVSAFQELKVNELLLGRKTLSCMLMVVDGQYQEARVISIATGNACLSEADLKYADDGTALHDCHAEILARRGLIKFLFEQIRQANEHKPSIFEYNSAIHKYQLHANITFHMYISSLPCGHASINTPSKSVRYKQGQAEGTVLKTTNPEQYSVISCSDKIYRWNILGIQGALLISLLAKPIYLESITLARETTIDRNRVKSSLCERFKEYLQSLPSPFECHVPDIDCPTVKTFLKERQVARLQPNAFAWSISQPDKMELLDPMTGKLKKDRSMSILSDRSFFEDFTELIQQYFPDDSSLSFTTYQDAKRLHHTYVEVKNRISTAFGMGSLDNNTSWPSKSDQLEEFSNA